MLVTLSLTCDSCPDVHESSNSDHFGEEQGRNEGAPGHGIWCGSDSPGPIHLPHLTSAR